MNVRTPLDNRIDLEGKTLERFLSKFERSGTDECWIWRDALSRDGYGHFALNYKPVPAHRLSYELSVGPIPKGRHIHHLCENTGCVNPNHLEALTPKEHVKENSGHSINKTHCKRGHEFTPENTYLYRGNRTCRACISLQKRKKLYPEDKGEKVKFSKFYWPLYCAEGHPLFGENQRLVTRKDGYLARQCKICTRKRANQYTKQHHDKVLAGKANRRGKERTDREAERAKRVAAVVRNAAGMDDAALLAAVKKALKG